MEHTKSPWKTVDAYHETQIDIQDETGHRIAVCVSGYPTPAPPRMEANAEYIVRACNAYPTMRAVLLNIQAHIDSGEYLRADDPEYADLKAALAAGGE